MAEALGYGDTAQAIRKHISDEDKMGGRFDAPSVTDNMGRTQYPVWINESGLYSLILSSKLESAKAFKHWVTAEVLPTIRKTGGYIFVKNHSLKRQSVYSEHQKNRYF